MKKCGSTASKSPGQHVEAIDSISLESTTTSVEQKNDTQSCRHFSLREYVADMMIKNPKACNPFDDLENTEIMGKQLQGPLDVPCFRWWSCENCVRGVDSSSPSSDHQRLNVEQTSLQLGIPVPEKHSSIEHRTAGGGIAADTNKAPVEVIILDDNEDEGIIEITRSKEELTRVEEKASAGKGVAIYTLQQTEKSPCLDKGKNIILEVLDNGEEIVKQPQETTKAISDSSRHWGDTEVEDNQTSLTFELPENINRGLFHGKAVLYNLNARITRTANILRNQETRNNPTSSPLDLSLSLCCPGTEENQKVENEGISVESYRKRKGTVDALANDSVSALKSHRMMQMGKFLEKPFTSCEIIDLESPSFSTNGSTRRVATADANHGLEFLIPLETGNTKRPSPFSANAGPYAKATGESSRPRGDKQKGPDKKSGTGANPQVRNVLNLAARHMGRPLNPMDQVCLTNRNPADFSEADPKNIYTRWWGCKTCVHEVVPSSTAADGRLNADQTSSQSCIPETEKDSSLDHLRAARGSELGHFWRCSEAINMVDNDGESEIPYTSPLELLTRAAEMAFDLPQLQETCQRSNAEKDSSFERRTAGSGTDAIVGEGDKSPSEVNDLVDSDDEREYKKVRSLKELMRVDEKASAGEGVTTHTLQQTEKKPSLSKGKDIHSEVLGQEFVRPQGSGKAKRAS